MLKIVIKIVGALIVLTGVIMIFDARVLTKRLFGFGDQNEASAGFKILGFIISVIGGALIYFI